jgi:hypothetical protein
MNPQIMNLNVSILQTFWSVLYGTSASVPTAAILASEPDQQPSAHVALPLSPFSVLVPSGTLNPRSPRLRITQTRVRASGEGTSSEAWLIAARVSRGASLIKNDSSLECPERSSSFVMFLLHFLVVEIDAFSNLAL